MYCIWKYLNFSKSLISNSWVRSFFNRVISSSSSTCNYNVININNRGLDHVIMLGLDRVWIEIDAFQAIQFLASQDLGIGGFSQSSPVLETGSSWFIPISHTFDERVIRLLMPWLLWGSLPRYISQMDHMHESACIAIIHISEREIINLLNINRSFCNLHPFTDSPSFCSYFFMHNLWLDWYYFLADIVCIGRCLGTRLSTNTNNSVITPARYFRVCYKWQTQHYHFHT